MCVLTYLPNHHLGFILTNNRDESVARPRAIPPKQYIINGKSIYFPKDAQAGGTWLATSSNITICLLNGAFENHVHQPPYRQSRGQVILDFFMFESVQAFIDNYDFSGIENFTLIFVQTTYEAIKLEEIRWDGVSLHHSVKDAREPHIWSSATLYTPSVRESRENWFESFYVNNPDFTREDLLNFHLHGGTGDAHNDMRINREGKLMTQCVFQVVQQPQYLSFSFHDLLAKQELRYRVL